MQSERMLHSLSAQVSYYSGLIQKNPDWEYAGVYADDFISGTNTVKRDEFKRMLADCEAGKIDIILTKSSSRFARNTVDLLETVRHLKDLGVEVRFEKERIRSMDGDGELMLTILASFAQDVYKRQVETLGNIFLPTSRQASCNYGIGVDGRVGMYVEEKNRSWCSSSNVNDQRAVTIECASDTTEPYAFKDVVYQTLITLCTDICKRNGKSKLLWLGDKDKTLSYEPKSCLLYTSRCV